LETQTRGQEKTQEDAARGNSGDLAPWEVFCQSFETPAPIEDHYPAPPQPTSRRLRDGAAEIIEVFDGLERKDKWVLRRCPVCEPSRKKKGVLCLSLNTEKGIIRCWHPSCSYSQPTHISRLKGEAPTRALEKIEAKPDYAPLDFQRLIAARQFTPLSDAGAEWLEKVRGIDPDLARASGVYTARPWYPTKEGTFHQEESLAFITKWGDDVLDVEYRTPDKRITSESDYVPFLWNLDKVVGHDGTLLYDDLIITEGRIDALTWKQCGVMNVVSLPKGGGEGVG
jgi:twinkle protein